MKKDKINVMEIFSKVEKMAEEYDGDEEVVVNISSRHAVKKTASFMCIHVSVGENVESIYFSPFTNKNDVDSFLKRVNSITHKQNY